MNISYSVAAGVCAKTINSKIKICTCRPQVIIPPSPLSRCGGDVPDLGKWPNFLRRSCNTCFIWKVKSNIKANHTRMGMSFDWNCMIVYIILMDHIIWWTILYGPYYMVDFICRTRPIIWGFSAFSICFTLIREFSGPSPSAFLKNKSIVDKVPVDLSFDAYLKWHMPICAEICHIMLYITKIYAIFGALTERAYR